jgi:hypothetical protein
MIVKVYYNIRKKCWSIQHKGKIISHARTVLLKNVSFKVSEAGRQRVLATKHKNVHAFARGELVEMDTEKPMDLVVKISYNPYLHGFFFNKETKERINGNEYVFCDDKLLFGK